MLGLLDEQPAAFTKEDGEVPFRTSIEATGVELRDAEPSDLPQILAIFNEVVVNSTAIYFHAPVSLANREAWFNARKTAGHPVIVAADGDEVIGFGSFGDWRPSPGYAWTVEHTVHVRADRRRMGVGRAIVEDLIERARAAGKHVMLGGVDAEMPPRSPCTSASASSG